MCLSVADTELSPTRKNEVIVDGATWGVVCGLGWDRKSIVLVGGSPNGKVQNWEDTSHHAAKQRRYLTRVNLAKTEEWIKVPFVTWTRVGPNHPVA